MKQTTAVEWLAQQLYEKMEMKGDGRVFDGILDQAGKMFMSQIRDTIIYSEREHKILGDVWPTQDVLRKAENYYEQTYGDSK